MPVSVSFPTSKREPRACLSQWEAVFRFCRRFFLRRYGDNSPFTFLLVVVLVLVLDPMCSVRIEDEDENDDEVDEKKNAYFCPSAKTVSKCGGCSSLATVLT